MSQGDTAYALVYEHTPASVKGETRKHSPRATQIYWRDEGQRKVAHRQVDAPMSEEEPEAARDREGMASVVVR
jgi:hypothetical protein